MWWARWSGLLCVSIRDGDAVLVPENLQNRPEIDEEQTPDRRSRADTGIRFRYGFKRSQVSITAARSSTKPVRYRSRSAFCCSRPKLSHSRNASSWLRRRASFAARGPNTSDSPWCSYTPEFGPRRVDR